MKTDKIDITAQLFALQDKAYADFQSKLLPTVELTAHSQVDSEQTYLYKTLRHRDADALFLISQKLERFLLGRRV